MKHVILIVICCLSFAAQVKAQNYYWIAFTDKDNSAYSLEFPEEYLSDRAIERRENQNIPIDSLDLPVNQIYIDSVLSLGVDFVHASKWLNGITVATELDSLEQQISAWTFVQETQLSKPGSLNKSAHTKNEKFSVELEPIDTFYFGESAVHQVSMLNGQYLHSNNFRGQGLQIAVIDAGFINADELPAFDSLWQNNQILGTKDILNLDTDIFNTPGDYHGMSVLSCMAGNIPGELIGTAPLASYWLIRSEDIQSEYLLEEDNWTVAAEFADSVGVDVINSSLGYYEFEDKATDHVYADMDGKTTRVTQAANIAASRGILVFTSAGNERDNTWKRIIAPSDGDLVIGVGAVDKELQPAYFTSAGPAADGAIKPNVSAMGYHTVVQRSDGSIGLANGTSFSSPVMAGMAASLWQKFPEKTAVELKDAIEKSAHQYNTPDSLLGYGVPNMQVASDLLSPQSVSFSQETQNWLVYPNPIHDKITLKNKGQMSGAELEIELYSMSGQLIRLWTKPVAQTIVLRDIPAQAGGMFLLRIKSDSSSQTFKLNKAN